MDQAATSNSYYPIGAVSAITGINSVTLRAWERRYGLLAPSRTDGGRRLYSEDDIDRIRQVQRFLQEGVPVSQVSRRLRQSQGHAGSQAMTRDTWGDSSARMLEAIGDFDERRLERAYNEVLELYPMEMVAHRLLLPLMESLGKRWESGAGSVAEEHFFTVYLRNKIGARFHHRSRRADGPLIVAACLPGEQHETGLLLLALAAHEHGFRVVLLGVNLPLQELPPVAERTRADALVLSGSVAPLPGVLKHDLRELAGRLEIPVFVGGRVATEQRHVIDSAGAVAVGQDPSLGLGRIAAHESLAGKFSA